MPARKPGSPIACMWMLTLEGGAPAKMYLCKSDPFAVTPATLSYNGFYFDNVQDGYEFSYSIVYPWAGNGVSPNWRGHLNTGVPIMSDMAPLSDGSVKDTTAPRRSHKANTFNHNDAGQNVLYGDTHCWNFQPGSVRG